MTPHFPAPRDPGWTWHESVTGRPYALPRCAWCGRPLRPKGINLTFYNPAAPLGHMAVIGWHLTREGDGCLGLDPLGPWTVHATWRDPDVRRRVIEEVRARSPRRIGPGDAWPRWAGRDEPAMNEPAPDRSTTVQHEAER